MKVAVLGATGLVGQRFVSLLDNHPWFDLAHVCASERSAGKSYEEAVEGRWFMKNPIPDPVKNMMVDRIDPKNVDADIVFSALPGNLAREIETEFLEAGFKISSNTKAYRKDEDVPIMIPEVNAEHLGLLDVQRKKRGWDGFVLTKPNCTTIVFSVPLKIVSDNYGIKSMTLSTMQALSGAGVKGLQTDLSDNLLPYISGEEAKCETEPQKILGKFNGEKIEHADFEVYSTCCRVNIIDGHTESAFIETKKPVDIEELKQKMRDAKSIGTHMAPDQLIDVMEEDDRPQPKLDRMKGNGMTVSVGRVRQFKPNFFRMVVMGHNAIRGAAGGAILTAELLKKEGYL